MKEIKSVGKNTIFEKKSGRYAIKGEDKRYINGEEKAKILADAGLVKIPEPKVAPVEEAAPEEAPAEE
ncbi:MAG: hypothetical protein AB8B89_00855 [Gammaproteobacteria bacterium]